MKADTEICAVILKFTQDEIDFIRLNLKFIQLCWRIRGLLMKNIHDVTEVYTDSYRNLYWYWS